MPQEINAPIAIDKIKSHVAIVAQSVEFALRQSIQSVPRRDRSLAQTTIVDDQAINRSIRTIDAMCQDILKGNDLTDRQLRLITSILRLNIALERLGDYAVTISRETLQLTQPLTPGIVAEVNDMSSDALRMLHQAIKAFNEGSVALAKGAMGYADHVDRSYAKVFEKLTRTMSRKDNAPQDQLATFTVFNMIERVSDQAKNICEETIFVVEGLSKQNKVYRLLFVDKTDDLLSQMAVSIGRKQFTGSAEFSSAGTGFSHQLDPRLISFMESAGYDLSNEKPRQLSEINESLDSFHVIIALGHPIQELIPRTPFHSLGLTWTFDRTNDLSASFSQMECQLNELMAQLRDRTVFEQATAAQI